MVKIIKFRKINLERERRLRRKGLGGKLSFKTNVTL